MLFTTLLFSTSPNYFYLYLFRTQSLSVNDREDQEDLLDELTLHPDPLTLEGLLCTSANVVEVHRDLQTGKENVFFIHKTEPLQL